MRNVRSALLSLAVVLVSSPASAQWVFADGFEVGDDRYWTGPLEACHLQDGSPAPLCPDSLDLESWLGYCERWPVVRCWRVCATDPATSDACVMLGLAQPYLCSQSPSPLQRTESRARTPQSSSRPSASRTSGGSRSPYPRSPK